VTTIYVTHDQTEAMTLGDRVAVMRDGVLQQFDVPQLLYDGPVNLFVAEFIGSPAMNLVGADLNQDGARLEAQFGDHRLSIDDEVLDARPALREFVGRRVILGIRPEDFEYAAEDSSGRRISAVVDIREDMGSEVFVHFGVGGPPVRGEDVKAAVGAEAVEATAELAKKQGSTFVARLGRGPRLHEGDKVELMVASGRLHFFDPETSLGIYSRSPAPTGDENLARDSDDQLQ
jgi:multiple sugar transport system ATP-binding protein